MGEAVTPLFASSQKLSDADLEAALLAALLFNNDVYGLVAQFLRPEHFADEAHSRVYEAASKMLDEGRRVDPVSIKPLFANDPVLQSAGGFKYLARITAAYMPLADAEGYGRTIMDLYKRRLMDELGARIARRSFDLEQPIARQIDDADAELNAIADTEQTPHSTDPDAQIRDAVGAIEVARQGGAVGRSTGLAALDRIIGGLRPGRLYLIGARPSMGKSALAVKLAEAGGNAWCYSGEMPATEWQERRLAIASKIPADKLSRGEISPSDANRVAEISLTLDRSIRIDDQPRLTMDTIRRRALRHAEKHPVGLVVIDHLGKVAPRDPDAMRVHQVGEITAACKDLSKEMNIPVVLLAQLNRRLEAREDRRPEIADIRDSGEIEQDADVIGFLYREAYYLERMPPKKREKESDEDFGKRIYEHDKRQEDLQHVAEVNIVKNRGGSTGLARLYWNGPLMLFGNLAQDERGPVDVNQGGFAL